MTDDYRKILIAAEQKSQDSYDKTIVSLSGGALGISLLFIKNIVGESEPVLVWAVITAWCLWAASITSVVISYFLSRMALRKAITQTDEGDYTGGVGGCAAMLTQIFNILSGAIFILGIVFLIIFAANNMEDNVMSEDQGKEREERGYVPPPPPKTLFDPEQPLTEGVIPPPPPPKPDPDDSDKD